MNTPRTIICCALVTMVACAANGCRREKPVELDAKALKAALAGQQLELEEERITMAADYISRFKVLDVARVPDSPHVSVGVAFEYFDRGTALSVEGAVSYEETAGGGIKDALFETNEVRKSE